MEKVFKSTIALVVILCTCLWVHGQKRGVVGIDINQIYNEWALSPESSENVLVYKDEYDLTRDEVVYDSSLNLKFTTYDNSFYLNYYTSRKPYIRCGNYIPRNLNAGPSHWKKGIWEVFEEDGSSYLVLKHLKAEKGKGYILRKKEIFQILELDEDKLILKKLENEI